MAIKSLFDNYQSFQLLNLKEDRKKYFDGKIDLAIKLSDSWGKFFIECVEGDKKVTVLCSGENLVHQ